MGVYNGTPGSVSGPNEVPIRAKESPPLGFARPPADHVPSGEKLVIVGGAYDAIASVVDITGGSAEPSGPLLTVIVNEIAGPTPGDVVMISAVAFDVVGSTPAGYVIVAPAENGDAAVYVTVTAAAPPER